MEHFIIGASLIKEELDYLGMVTVTGANVAHRKVADAYRKDYELPSSRHIFTRTLLRGKSAEKTESIFKELMAKYEELGKEILPHHPEVVHAEVEANVGEPEETAKGEDQEDA